MIENSFFFIFYIWTILIDDEHKYLPNAIITL